MAFAILICWVAVTHDHDAASVRAAERRYRDGLTGMEAVLMLAPAPSSAAAARVLVQETLPGWGCDELLDDARLVVTELVSNAVLHARTTLQVQCEVNAHALRIAVTDSAAGAVAVRSFDPRNHLGGRGLRIVEDLADRWGIDRTDDGGKTVWAEWLLPR